MTVQFSSTFWKISFDVPQIFIILLICCALITCGEARQFIIVIWNVNVVDKFKNNIF